MSAEAIVNYVYYTFVGALLALMIISTLIWTFRVYYLGHFPEKRPSWLKRPIKEMLYGTAICLP